MFQVVYDLIHLPPADFIRTLYETTKQNIEKMN
jgi:hypothetical protein